MSYFERVPVKRTLGLSLYLLTSSLAAMESVYLHYKGLDLALGWSIRPGHSVLLFILLISTYGILRGREIKSIGIICFLNCLPMLIEFLPIPYTRSLWGWLGIISSMIGAAYAYTAENGCFLVKTSYWIIAAYIQSVFVYNLFHTEQLMMFFHSGYTT
jgi:hypothetical protein